MGDWQKDLQDFFNKKEQKAEQEVTSKSQIQSQVDGWYEHEVMPALNELKEGLEKLGKTVQLSEHRPSGGSAGIKVTDKGSFEIDYRVETDVRPLGHRVYPNIERVDWKDGRRFRSEGYFHSGSGDTIQTVNKATIIAHFVKEYKDTMQFKR